MLFSHAEIATITGQFWATSCIYWNSQLATSKLRAPYCNSLLAGRATLRYVLS